MEYEKKDGENNTSFDPLNPFVNLKYISTVLSDIFYIKEGKFLGFMKSEFKVPILLQGLEECPNIKSILDILQSIFSASPEVYQIVKKYSSMKGSKTFIQILIEKFLSNNISVEVKESIINILSEIISYNDLTIDDYNNIYDSLSKSYFRNEKGFEVDTNNVKSVLKLLGVMYGINNKKSHDFPKNFIFHHGKGQIKQRIEDSKIQKKSFDGLVIKLSFMIKHSGESMKMMNNSSISSIFKLVTQSQKKVETTFLSISLNEKYNKIIITLGNDKKEIPIKEKIWYDLKLKTSITGFTSTKFAASVFLESTEPGSALKTELAETEYPKEDSRLKFIYFENFYGYSTSIIIFIDKGKVEEHQLFSNESFKDFEYGISCNKSMKNFIKISSKLVRDGSLRAYFTPLHFNKKILGLEDTLQNNIAIIEQENSEETLSSVYNFYNHCKHIDFIGGINPLLPLMEIIYCKELYDVFPDYIELVEKIIAKSKNNFLSASNSLFFRSLAPFLENLPNHVFTDEILQSFLKMEKAYLKYFDYLSKNTPKSKYLLSFLENILFNEKIFVKFSPKEQNTLLSDIPQTLFDGSKETQEVYLKSFWKVSKIAFFLKYYQQRYKNFNCCLNHTNLYDTIKYDNLTAKCPLSEILNPFIQIISYVLMNGDETSQNFVYLFKLFKSNDSWPLCIQEFILDVYYDVFKTFSSNDAIERQKILINSGILDTILCYMGTSWLSVRKKILDLIALIMNCFAQNFELEWKGYQDKIFVSLKEFLIPFKISIPKPQQRRMTIQCSDDATKKEAPKKRARSVEKSMSDMNKNHLYGFLNFNEKPYKKPSRIFQGSLSPEKGGASPSENSFKHSKSLGVLCDSERSTIKDYITSFTSIRGSAANNNNTQKTKEETVEKYYKRKENNIEFINPEKLNEYYLECLDSLIKWIQTCPQVNIMKRIYHITLRFVSWCSNLKVLLKFTETIKKMIEKAEKLPNEPIASVKKQKDDNLYLRAKLYESDKSYYWLIETMFHIYMLTKTDTFVSSFCKRDEVAKNKELLEQIYNNCRSIHDSLIFSTNTGSFKNLKTNSYEIFNTQTKETEKKKKNVYHILTWGLYQKNIFLSLKDSQKNIFHLTSFMIEITMKIIDVFSLKFFEDQSKIISNEKYLLIGNLIYENIISFQKANEIVFNKEGFLETVSPLINVIGIPSFFGSSITYYNNESGLSGWFGYKLYEKFYKILNQYWSLRVLLEEAHLSGVETFANEEAKFLGLQSIVKNLVFQDFGRFERDLMNFTLTGNCGYGKVDCLPIAKIVGNMFTLSLTVVMEEEGKVSLANDYQQFLIYLIVASTNQCHKKTKTKISKSVLNASMKVIQQILLFAFHFLGEDEFADVFSGILYLTILILTDKDSNLITSSPIYQIFQKQIVDEEGPAFPFQKIFNKDNPCNKENIMKFILDKGNKEKWKKCLDNRKENIEFLSNLFDKEYFSQITKERFKDIKSITPFYEIKISAKDFLSDNLNFIKKCEIRTKVPYYSKTWQRFLDQELPKETFIEDQLEKYYTKNDIEEKKKIKAYYRNKKSQFIFRGMWSDKDLFFNHIEKIKMKIHNHYTSEFSMPFSVPVLDFDYYLPTFRYFKTSNLFLKNDLNLPYKIDLNIRKIIRLHTAKQKECHKTPKQDPQSLSSSSFLMTSQSLSTDSYIDASNAGRQSNNSNSNHSGLNINCKVFKCCLVKQTHHIQGEIYYDNKIRFNPKKYPYDQNDINYDEDNGVCFGSFFKANPKDDDMTQLRIKPGNILYIFKRKYFYRNHSLEIFTSCHKSYFFHFTDQNSRDEFLKLSTAKIKNKNEIRVNQRKDDPVIGYANCNTKKFKNTEWHISPSSFLSKWRDMKMSSFEFIMWCNIFSNRSYRDLTQYPVFPWPFEDYSSTKEDLKSIKNKILMAVDLRLSKLAFPSLTDQKEGSSNEKDEDKDFGELKNTLENRFYIKTRDFSLPMGMMCLTQDGFDRKEGYINDFEEMKKEARESMIEEESSVFDSNNFPYVYGSHYSNPMYVAYYLSRVLPFSQTKIELQGDKFDSPSRMFLSMSNSFECAASTKCDIRELIPESYYLIDMYYNYNNLDMGKGVEDVELPPWCEGKPYVMFSKMKKVLERDNSPEEGTNVNSWIDLIFGYKQQGKKAEESFNVYMQYTYENKLELDSVKNKMETICYMRMVEIGLTPHQIFFKDKVNPRKFKIGLQITKSKEFESSSLGKIENTKGPLSKVSFIKFNDEGNLSLIFGNSTKIQVSFKIGKGTYKMQAVDYRTNTVKKIFIKNSLQVNTMLPKYEAQKLSLKTLFCFDGSRKAPIVLYSSDRIVVQGGYYDGRIMLMYKVAQDEEKVETKYIKPDKSICVALAIDKTELHGFSGTAKGSLCLFAITNTTEWNLRKKINDHSDEITSLVVNNNLNIVGTASYDGYVNIYTIPRLKHIRSIKLKGDGLSDFYADILFISSTPVPCISIYCKKCSNFLNVFQSFYVNGRKIDINKESNPKKGFTEGPIDASEIVSYTTFIDCLAKEYLVTGMKNGKVKIRRFPDMKLVNEYQASKGCIRAVEVRQGEEILYINDENEVFVLNDKELFGDSMQSNLQELGLDL